MAPTSHTGVAEDGTLDLGQGGTTPYRFKDAHFSGTVNADAHQVAGGIDKTAQGYGLFPLTAPMGSTADSNSRRMALDLGESNFRFKDAHFGGTVNATTKGTSFIALALVALP